jgi:hypothetical protein
MLAKADRSKGGIVHAELMTDPQFALEVAIAKMREQAAARGEPLPLYYRLVPYDGPVLVKQPGYKRRKRRERGAP